MIDPSDMELAAMTSCLAPLGEYVGSIGMQRPLADYSKDEVLMLIDVVVSDRAVRVITATDSQELLPRHATTPTHVECKFCPWQDRCWSST